MARQKIQSTYKTWEDVNKALKKLAELRIQKQKLEGEQTLRINEIKEETSAKSGILIEAIKAIEKDITRFAEEHKDEFAKKRSKKLLFGTISFKQSKKIVCNMIESSIKCLKALGLYNCVRVKEELDKEQLMEVDEHLLTKAQIQLKRTDNISIEPNFELIAANQD